MQKLRQCCNGTDQRIRRLKLGAGFGVERIDRIRFLA